MTDKTAFMVVCTKATAGKEAAYNQWYDEHVSLIFTYPAIRRVSRNLCTRPLGPSGVNSPQYIVLYELENKDEIPAFFGSSQMQGAKKQFDESWAGVGDILWSGWYEARNTLQRKPLAGQKRYTEIVGSGPVPGNEKAYLDYYVDHFTKMFEYSGIKQISYSRGFQKMAQDQPSPEYLTVYDFESAESRDAFYQHPVFTSGGPDWEKHGQPVMDLLFAACYDSVKLLEK